MTTDYMLNAVMLVKDHPRYKNYLKPRWGLGFLKRDAIPDDIIAEIIKREQHSYATSVDSSDKACNYAARGMVSSGAVREWGKQTSTSILVMISIVQLIISVWRLLKKSNPELINAN